MTATDLGTPHTTDDTATKIPSRTFVPDPNSWRRVHEKLSDEQREEFREFRDQWHEMTLALQRMESMIDGIKEWQVRHEPTLMVMSQVVSASAGLQSGLKFIILLLSLVGGMGIAWDLMVRWLGR